MPPAARQPRADDVVRDAPIVQLFAPADAEDLARQLQTALLADALRKRMAGEGAAWVAKNLSREAAARRMEEIYRQYLD